MTADLLSELSSDGSVEMTPDETVAFFGWASRLGLVYRKQDGYRLDSTYAAGLKAHFDG